MQIADNKILRVGLSAQIYLISTSRISRFSVNFYKAQKKAIG